MTDEGRLSVRRTPRRAVWSEGTLRRQKLKNKFGFVNEELAEQPAEQRADGLHTVWLEMQAEHGRR
ncbi:hypothetical protein [Streptomyces bluensis]|uniref:Uncharacterized protein n=1 Tax=Streptomyces bluensis TaxID=33897 RepID=A0ABW6UAV9_9ACTN